MAYSAVIGSFERKTDLPLEAKYIFSTYQELVDFYDTNPEWKDNIHLGLLKIVENDGEGKQALYWVTKSENQGFTFTKLISSDDIKNILNDITRISDKLYWFLNEKDPTTASIDTWKELQDFLAPYSDQDNLKTLLDALYNKLHIEVQDVIGSPIPSPDFRTLRAIEDWSRTDSVNQWHIINDVHEELDNVKDGVGLDGSGKYSPDYFTNYLKNATSVMNALRTLDGLIADVKEELDNLPERWVSNKEPDPITTVVGTLIFGNIADLTPLTPGLSEPLLRLDVIIYLNSFQSEVVQYDSVIGSYEAICIFVPSSSIKTEITLTDTSWFDKIDGNNITQEDFDNLVNFVITNNYFINLKNSSNTLLRNISASFDNLSNTLQLTYSTGEEIVIYTIKPDLQVTKTMFNTGGVETVTGDFVNNTDPKNPKIAFIHDKNLNIFFDAVNGNDDNDGLSISRPIKTITGLYRIRAKNIFADLKLRLYFKEGTYNFSGIGDISEPAEIIYNGDTTDMEKVKIIFPDGDGYLASRDITMRYLTIYSPQLSIYIYGDVSLGFYNVKFVTLDIILIATNVYVDYSYADGAMYFYANRSWIDHSDVKTMYTYTNKFGAYRTTFRDMLFLQDNSSTVNFCKFTKTDYSTVDSNSLVCGSVETRTTDCMYYFDSADEPATDANCKILAYNGRVHIWAVGTAAITYVDKNDNVIPSLNITNRFVFGVIGKGSFHVRAIHGVKSLAPNAPLFRYPLWLSANADAPLLDNREWEQVNPISIKHNYGFDRDEANCHPMSAITGLTYTIDTINSSKKISDVSTIAAVNKDEFSVVDVVTTNKAIGYLDNLIASVNGVDVVISGAQKYVSFTEEVASNVPFLKSVAINETAIVGISDNNTIYSGSELNRMSLTTKNIYSGIHPTSVVKEQNQGLNDKPSCISYYPIDDLQVAGNHFFALFDDMKYYHSINGTSWSLCLGLQNDYYYIAGTSNGNIFTIKLNVELLISKSSNYGQTITPLAIINNTEKLFYNPINFLTINDIPTAFTKNKQIGRVIGDTFVIDNVNYILEYPSYWTVIDNEIFISTFIPKEGIIGYHGTDILNLSPIKIDTLLLNGDMQNGYNHIKKIGDTYFFFIQMSPIVKPYVIISKNLVDFTVLDSFGFFPNKSRKTLFLADKRGRFLYNINEETKKVYDWKETTWIDKNISLKVSDPEKRYSVNPHGTYPVLSDNGAGLSARVMTSWSPGQYEAPSTMRYVSLVDPLVQQSHLVKHLHSISDKIDNSLLFDYTETNWNI